MTTQKTIANLFATFCKAYNLRTRGDITTKQDNPQQPTFYSHDFIKMDYNPHYGGYRMDVVTTDTGERFFDGMGRKSGKEMVCYLQGLLAAKQSYNFDNIIKP